MPIKDPVKGFDGVLPELSPRLNVLSLSDHSVGRCIQGCRSNRLL